MTTPVQMRGLGALYEGSASPLDTSFTLAPVSGALYFQYATATDTTGAAWIYIIPKPASGSASGRWVNVSGSAASITSITQSEDFTITLDDTDAGENADFNVIVDGDIDFDADGAIELNSGGNTTINAHTDETTTSPNLHLLADGEIDLTAPYVDIQSTSSTNTDVGVNLNAQGNRELRLEGHRVRFNTRHIMTLNSQGDIYIQSDTVTTTPGRTVHIGGGTTSLTRIGDISLAPNSAHRVAIGGGLTLGGGMIATGNVDFTGATVTGITLSAALGTTAGDITGGVSFGGASGTVSVSKSDHRHGFSDTVTHPGNLTINTSGASNNFILTSDRNIEFRADNQVNIWAGYDGTLPTVPSESDDLTMGADDSVYLYANDDIFIRAGTSSDDDISITAGGDVRLTASNDIELSTGTGDGDDIILNSGGYITLNPGSGEYVRIGTGTARVGALTNVTPLANGTANVGNSNFAARSNHVHPAGTSGNINQTDSYSITVTGAGSDISLFTTGTGDSDIVLNASNDVRLTASNDIELSTGTGDGDDIILNSGGYITLNPGSGEYVRIGTGTARVGALTNVTPLANGTANVGNSNFAARSNHVHPAGTSGNINQTDSYSITVTGAGSDISLFTTGTGDSDIVLNASNDVRLTASNDIELSTGTGDGDDIILNSGGYITLNPGSGEYVRIGTGTARVGALTNVTPLANGTANVGNSNFAARSNHVHPAGTSGNINQTDSYSITVTGAGSDISLFTTGTGDSDIVLNASNDVRLTASNDIELSTGTGDGDDIILNSGGYITLNPGSGEYVRIGTGTARVGALTNVTPLANGTANVGNSNFAARSNHVHPAGTSGNINQTDSYSITVTGAGSDISLFTTGTGDSDIVLNASNDVRLTASNDIELSTGTGDGDDIILNSGGYITLNPGSGEYVRIGTGTARVGALTNVTPLANGTANVGNSNFAARSNHVHPAGTSGNINQTDSYSITVTGAGSDISLFTTGTGDSDIVLNASNDVRLTASNDIELSTGTGDGDDIILNSGGYITLNPGSGEYVRIGTGTARVGALTNVTPLANGTANVGNSNFAARSNHVHPAGTSGNINQTDSYSITVTGAGSDISLFTTGTGDSDIVLNASNDVRLTASNDIELSTGTGDGDDIILNSGGYITLNPGSGEYVRIGTGRVGALSSATPLANGTAMPGNSNFASRSNHVHPGTSGNINQTASYSVSVTGDNSGIFLTTSGGGTSSNILINAADILRLVADDSVLIRAGSGTSTSADTITLDAAGNITIDSEVDVIINSGSHTGDDISLNATAGEIDLTASYIDINATGSSGVIISSSHASANVSIRSSDDIHITSGTLTGINTNRPSLSGADHLVMTSNNNSYLYADTSIFLNADTNIDLRADDDIVLNSYGGSTTIMSGNPTSSSHDDYNTGEQIYLNSDSDIVLRAERGMRIFADANTTFTNAPTIGLGDIGIYTGEELFLYADRSVFVRSGNSQNISLVAGGDTSSTRGNILLDAGGDTVATRGQINLNGDVRVNGSALASSGSVVQSGSYSISVGNSSSQTSDITLGAADAINITSGLQTNGTNGINIHAIGKTLFPSGSGILLSTSNDANIWIRPGPATGRVSSNTGNVIIDSHRLNIETLDDVDFDVGDDFDIETGGDFEISAMGIISTNKTISQGSDIRIKSEIKDIEMENVFDIIGQMHPRQFYLHDEENVSFGFIAQELNQVLPELVVAQNKSCVLCLNGEECERHKMWGIKYSEVIPIIVKSLQEMHNKDIIQQEEIETQRNKIQEQEKRISDLESRLERLESMLS